jgi:ADP-ribosylglycohydrolase
MSMTAWSNMIRGVALGDAWGDPNEFGAIAGLIKDNPQGPDIPAHLRITDDTQMTLYLGAALDDTWGQDMATVKLAIAEAFKTYQRDPDNNRAPGITVMSSLGRLNADGSNWKVATNPTSDGSGTVMRTSPTAFLSKDRWVGVTAYAAALTHGSPTGIAAAILNVAILRDILAGKATVGNLLWHAHALADSVLTGVSDLTEVGDWLDGYEVDLVKGFEFLVELIEKALAALPELRGAPWTGVGSDPSMAVPEGPGKGGGWRAPYTLVIALLAADMLPGKPMEALRRSVTTDGDSDTIGAVTGAILGACYPGVFLDMWEGEGGLRDRFEPRYVAWIENEADDYEFAVPVHHPHKKHWLKGLLGRN